MVFFMYSIIRINKLKTNQQIKAAVSHNLRLYEVPNADPAKKELNQNFLANNFGEVMEKLEDRIEKNNIKTRADSVKVVEVLLTASPDFFKDESTLKNWIKQNQKFAIKEFGKENLLQFNVHLDETTPHIHLLFTPITKDNRLSCKDLYGGKAKLSALQTRYNEFLKPNFPQLKRGKEDSKAKHTTIQKFYKLANKIKQLNKEQLRELAELISMFEHTNETNIKNTLSAEIEENLKLLDTINKVKPMLKMNKKL